MASIFHFICMLITISYGEHATNKTYYISYRPGEVAFKYRSVTMTIFTNDTDKPVFNTPFLSAKATIKISSQQTRNSVVTPVRRRQTLGRRHASVPCCLVIDIGYGQWHAIRGI